MLSGSKKGIRSNQLGRALGVTLKSAWFPSHRIREAMRDGALAPGEVAEADKTYIGKKAGVRTETTSGRPFTKSGKGGVAEKRAIVSLVQRSGKVLSFHVDRADKATVAKAPAPSQRIRFPL